MRKLFATAALAALLAACQPPAAQQSTPTEAATPPAPVVLTEAEASAIADKLGETVAAGNLDQVVALYAPDAVAFSALSNDMITTTEANRADGEAILKLAPKTTLNARKVQVLDADTFVDSGVMTWDITKNGKPTWIVVRYTDVFQKQTDGSWKVVAEHLSPTPQPVKTRPAPLTAAAEPAPDTPPLGSVRPSATTPEAPAEAPKTP